jgi:putative transposase
MARMPRVVVPHVPHHVTQRGCRRQQTFFAEHDYQDYLALLRQNLPRAGVDIWAYCLMPNHVHLVAVPHAPEGLAKLFRITHLNYTQRINLRYDWRGHLWQERFHSFAMDERHLLMAVRYVELNPIRAGLCRRPEDWPWSSVHAHLRRRHDPVVDADPMLARIDDWAAYLGHETIDSDLDLLRRHGRTGRPAGSEDFIGDLERRCGRCLRPQKRGPKTRVE